MKYRQPPDSRDPQPNRDSDRDRRREHIGNPDRDDNPDDDHFNVRDVLASYNAKAPTLVRDYEDLLFEEVHAPVLDLLPDPGAHILDMGAGSGRDAAWFAANGYSVVAAEPSAEMRNLGKTLHPSPNIRWLDDALPAQEKVLRSKLTFDLIWLSAVWMHVPPSARARAFRKLVSVMSPGGSMMLTLRQGPPPADRPMEPATAADVEVLARRHGLQTVRSERIPDILGRDGIAWEVIWLRLPDDGTGALPLLRHVVLNDRKSSTYKLALLRTVIRVADGAGGLARPGRDERFVDLPLGLVALFWVRSFQAAHREEPAPAPRRQCPAGLRQGWLSPPAGAFRARSPDRPAIHRRRCPGPDPRAARRREVHPAHARHVHHVSGKFRSHLSVRAKAGADPGYRSRRRGVPVVVRHVLRARQPVAGDEPLRRVDRARGAQRVDRDDARLRPPARLKGRPHGGAQVA